MTRSLILGWGAALALLVPLLGACAEPETAGRGSLTVGLAFEDAGWFQMRVFEGPSTDLLTPSVSGRELFDTGCIEMRSRTFEVTDLEAGPERSVVFEAFGGADCRRESRVALGYRGSMTIAEEPAEQPYYHVPVYDSQAVTALPEDINLSASVAERIDSCEVDADCTGVVSPGGGCFKILGEDQSTFNFWCVPTCTNSADCQTIHPGATCDVSTGWCMMRQPFPLNMAEPRALGHAATLSDGSVLLAGGFGQVVGTKLTAATRAFERFDASTGLFSRVTISDVPGTSVGLAGFTRLGPERFALAGGVLAAELRPVEPGGVFGIQQLSIGGEFCSGDGCEPNVTDRLVIFDTARGRGAVTRLPARVAMPALVSSNPQELLVLGGAVPTGEGDATERSKTVWTCTISDAMTAVCEPTGEMTTGRAGAAASCLDPLCDRVLIVGGNAGGSGIEVMDRSGEQPVFTAFSGTGSPGPIFAPRLCGSRIVGGGAGTLSAGGLSFVSIQTDDFALEPLETQTSLSVPLLPAVAAMNNGDCWVAGGINADGENQAAIRRVTATAVAPDVYPLNHARFGAQAAAVGGGALSGSILVAGGLELDRGTTEAPLDPPRIVLVRGAEVLRP